MHKLLPVFASLSFIVLLALLTTLWLAIEDQPRVDRQIVLTPDHIGRAKKILDAHRHWVKPGMMAMATVTPDDADLAANYLAHRLWKGNAELALADRNAGVRLSVPMSAGWLNGYLNLEAALVEKDGLPQLRSVQIGRLLLPDTFTDMVVSLLVQWLRRSPEYRTGFDALRRVKLSRRGLSVVYRWPEGFSGEMKASIVGDQERERLLRYQTLLTSLSRQTGTAVPLAEILSPLMRFAAEHSMNGDAVAENRAVILVVTFHVLGIPLKQILPQITALPRPVSQVVMIDGRDDFAKHFMVSAAIAAYADTALSDAIGLYKEIEDSRHGSGFSFNDLAADRAGTKFGEKGVASEASARQLQHRAGAALEDADLMPAWTDLPEFLPEAEFRRRFGGTDSPAYRQMMAKIEERIAALAVLQ